MYEQIFRVDTLSWLQLLFTHGLWKLLSLIWIPCIILGVLTSYTYKNVE